VHSSSSDGEGDAFDAAKYDAKRLALDATAMEAMQAVALVGVLVQVPNPVEPGLTADSVYE